MIIRARLDDLRAAVRLDDGAGHDVQLRLDDVNLSRAKDAALSLADAALDGRTRCVRVLRRGER
jgi:hypothetical protein